MRCLIWNDIKGCSKYIILYYVIAALIVCQNLENILYFIQSTIYFYCIVLVLYSSLINNIAYFYTLFPRKRYFLILEKNITIFILDLLFNITYNIVVQSSGITFWNSVMSYWVIGSLVTLYFFQFRISYANSILQLTFYAILIISYIFFKDVTINEMGTVVCLLIAITINLINIILYNKKDFYINRYKH